MSPSPSSPPAPAPSSGHVSFGLAAAIIAGTAVILNVAFLVLSKLYFASHVTFVAGQGETLTYTPAMMMSVRIAFAVLTLVVGAAAIAAVAQPKLAAHAIGLLMGAGSFVAGCVAAMRGLPGALIGAELVLGALMPFLAVRSWTGSRPAWAFLTAMFGVYAIVLFFGAPTVHRVLGVGLWTSLILPGLNIVALVSLVQLRGNYREA